MVIQEDSRSIYDKATENSEFTSGDMQEGPIREISCTIEVNQSIRRRKPKEDKKYR